MANTETQTALKVADEVWIIAALLHRDHPEAPDFAVEEIVRRAEREGLHKPLRRGVYVHIIQHCVANRPPNPGRYRMLFETSRAGGDCSAKVIHTILSARAQRTKVRCFLCGVQDGISGLTSTRTIMYVACVRAGNEPHFLGHHPIHLFVRGLWVALEGRRTPSF